MAADFTKRIQTAEMAPDQPEYCSSGGFGNVYNVTFQQIEAFLAIARYLNLSKAGEALYTSQPALSKTLKRFEEALGMRLFTRSNQGMTLTAEGESLYAVLEPLYKTMDRSIEFVQKNAVSPLKTLRIVAPTSFDDAECFELLNKTLKDYEARYPDVAINELLLDFKELRQALEFGSVDLVFTEDFGIQDLKSVSVRRVSRFTLYLAMSREHPLAQKDTLDPEALSEETFYVLPMLDNEQADVDNMINSCRQLGFTPKKVEFMPNFATLVHAVKLGKGMSIFGKSNLVGLDGDIKYFRADAIVSPYVVVAWRTGRLSREAKNFLDMLPAEPEASPEAPPPEDSAPRAPEPPVSVSGIHGKPIRRGRLGDSLSAASMKR
jgi:DNA-binding transcriptional LysR family regulator